MSAEDPDAIWNRLVEAYQNPVQTPQTTAAYSQALAQFFSPWLDRVPTLRRALRSGERALALSLFDRLNTQELTQLFDDLVFLASWTHGSLEFVRQAILALPREWVVQQLPVLVEPLLSRGTDEEYRRFLELFERIDGELAVGLAQRAASSTNPDVQEVGTEFLSRLKRDWL